VVPLGRAGVPLRFPAVVALVAVAAVLAVMLVLQENPVPLVHSKALEAVEHEGTDWPVGATAVKEPRS